MIKKKNTGAKNKSKKKNSLMNFFLWNFVGARANIVVTASIVSGELLIYLLHFQISGTILFLI